MNLPTLSAEMSSGSGGSRGSRKKDGGGGDKDSKKSVSSAVLDLFGSEVDIRVRRATGNPRVEQYFGSEVELQPER